MTKMINKNTKLYAGDKFAITTTDGRKLRLVIDQDDVCGLPLYITDHSGISMQTYRFDAWDSSFVGLIFVEKNFYLAQTCLKDEEGWKEKAKKTLEGEVKTYSDFLEGNVYGWTLYEPTVVIRQSMDGKELSRTIDEEGEVVDSMGGFYDPTLEDVEEYFDFEIAEIKQID